MTNNLKQTGTAPYNIVPAINGFSWVKDATELLRGNFARWLVLFVTYFALFFLSFIHPLFSIVFSVINPVMWGGIFLAGMSTVARLEWGTSILFEPLKKNAPSLIRLGIIVTLSMSVIMMALMEHFSTLIDFEKLEQIRLEMNKTQDIGPFIAFFSDPVLIQKLSIAILIALLVTLPIMMAGWYAPVLIMEKGFNIFKALKVSFQACSANFMAFLIYGIIGFILSMLVVMTAYIGLIFIGPLFFASYYCSYMDVFPEETQNIGEDDESNSTLVV